MFDRPARRASAHPPAPHRGALHPALAAVLDAPGERLEPGARARMERRFGRDFGGVRVHDDAKAAAAARAIGAQAFTVGAHIGFAAGRHAPGSPAGTRLLAHELAHVAQQDAREAPAGPLPPATPAQEREADRAAAAAAAGGAAPAIAETGGVALARFGDSHHHALEEAALWSLPPAIVEMVHRGNTRRDYSQAPAGANLALIGQFSRFGGYAAEQHFDNFRYDRAKGAWVARGGRNLFLAPGASPPTPIDYIRCELMKIALRPTPESYEHLGNALHTIEDFFAHSNFIELMGGDLRFGPELVTGSFEDDPNNKAVSAAHTVGAISAQGPAALQHARAEAATARTEPLSHSRLAKDEPSARGFALAQLLAALVAREIAFDVVRVAATPDAAQRLELMKTRVVAKIARYLRPPTREDPWWEPLLAQRAPMEARLEEAERHAVVTINQTMLSPARMFEATAPSPLLMLGPAGHAGGRTFVQIGAALYDPDFASRPGGAPPPAADPALFFGLQATGHF